MRLPFAVAVAVTALGCAPEGGSALMDAGAPDWVLAADLAPTPPDLELPLRDPAAHPRAEQIVPHGGRTLKHIEVVTVVWQGDALAAARHRFASYAVASPWIDLAVEYQGGRGTAVGPFSILDPPPDVLLDSQVGPLLRAQIGKGVLPPPGPDTLYVLYLSPQTISRTPFGDGCLTYGGYHWYTSSGRTSPPTMAYAIIPACDTINPMVELESDTMVASHEIIEAISDPEGSGWNNDPMPESEVGDLCNPLAIIADDGNESWRLARYWSQARAASGDADPCVPAPPSPYVWFNAALDPTELDVVAPNSGATVTTWKVEPFAAGAVGRIDWSLSGSIPGVSFSPRSGHGFPGSSQLITVTTTPFAEPGPHQVQIDATSKVGTNVWVGFVTVN